MYQRQHVVTLLTLVVTAAWVGTLIARTVIPAFPGGSGADAAMILVVTWWFASQGRVRNGS